MKAALLGRLQAARAAKARAALVTDLTSGAQCLIVEGAAQGELRPGPALIDAVEAALARDKGATVEIGGVRHFIQVFNPPKRLILVGAVHISQALAPMAAMAGYAVTVIDPRGAWATDARFPGIALDDRWPDEAMEALAPDRRSAVVTLTHDPKLDDPALIAALGSDAFYIGALGSKRTHARRLERLSEAGIAPDAQARVHGPVGLAIGAVSPAEIAIAILAQITQALHAAPAEAP